MAINYERTWETRRDGGRSVTDESRTSYYGVPTIRKPHWKWMIIWYFFLGGISGASYVVASITQVLGGAGSRPIVQAGRYISLATLIPSTVLLIWDLKKPSRFHHMLRVIKLRSPMSVGTWVLTIFGGFCGLSALIQAAEDGQLRRVAFLNRLLLAMPSRAIGVLGTPIGFFTGGYTGVLIAATAVPLWAKNALLLGPLFLASALSNAAAAITLVLSLRRGTSQQTFKRLERLDLVVLIAELGLLLAARANLGPVIGRPLREGWLGQIYRWGVLGMGITAPLAFQIKSKITGTTSRFEAGLSSALILVGGFLLRYLLVMGGRKSADDPEATFEFTRLNGQRSK